MPGPSHQSKEIAQVPCAVVTVSDSRTPRTDESGKLIRDLLTERGHTVHSYELVRDEPEAIRNLLVTLRDDAGCAAILITGGTGLAARDGTYEVVSELLDKRVDGFGELFRRRSYEEIGPAAMLSRAVAGVMGRTVVFSMPGSTAAVRLAMRELVLPELGHIVYLLSS